MNLTLYLSPEIESRLIEQARAEGRSPEDIALAALKNGSSSAAGDSIGELLSKDSRLAKFRALIASMPDGNPDADLSRDSAYGDRGR